MNSFKGKGFSPEELAALSPWQLPVMGEEEPPEPEAETSVVEEEVEAPRFPTAEEIEAMQKQAYDEASGAGYREGSERGYREGREQGLREGHDEGYAAGYAAGQNEGRAAMLDAKARFEQLVGCLDEPLARVDDQVEEELIALVIAIARQLIRRELHNAPGEIVAVVREAMGILPASSRKVTVHLNPDDAELVRSTLTHDEHPPRWKIIEDPALTRGGCRVTTETSYLDATVEKRLAAAIARLLGGERGEDHP
jgi:flagellar assembly protein FliH